MKNRPTAALQMEALRNRSERGQSQRKWTNPKQKTAAISCRCFASGRQVGFEPTTHGTTIRYSNQLSYNRHVWACKSTTFFITFYKILKKFFYYQLVDKQKIAISTKIFLLSHHPIFGQTDGILFTSRLFFAFPLLLIDFSRNFAAVFFDNIKNL